MTIKRTTLHGHKATRRIKWYNPKSIWDKGGEKYVNVFVVAVIGESGFELFAVTAQLGIDGRGRHVLPHSVVAPKGRFAYGGKSEGTTAIYAIGAPVGRLEEAGRELVAGLNKISARDMWMPPAGVKRGQIQIPSPEHIRTPV
ncbi:hypothetical protein D3C85_372850 [compost metagenome]